ncbi:hypothetical protein C8F01DRAFT_1286695 [Mycena amicta]|nr:hypothetical protein C8F01DRAFT_1286695 [Mycena amicta]
MFSSWTSGPPLPSSVFDAGYWNIVVFCPDKLERTFASVKHVVFATGVSSPEGRISLYSGQELFKIFHSTRHNHISKKVVVVGACTSARDIAGKMYQRLPIYVISQKTLVQHMMRPIYWEGGSLCI